jgi:hypothetical protein
MLEAFLPMKNKMMSYIDYRQFALELGYEKPNDAPSALCPVCEGAMKIRAGQTKGDGHFYHNDNNFCPTKEPAKRPYLNLPPRNADAAATEANRMFARENIELIYARLKCLVPCLAFKEFIDILKEAKRLNIYGYANATGAYLPYVYVTLINFLPSKSYEKRRIFKFLFFYENKIKTYEDLWINRGFESNLFRISYEDGEPKQVKKIETSIDYLNEEPAVMTDRGRKWCYETL